MSQGNEIAFRECRFLDETYFDVLYQTFLDAFSDYVFPFALTETQFRNHIRLNAVDLNRTVGCFRDGRLVGFSLNGFGQWKGQPTVYDAGTGVTPAARREGVSEAMFDHMFPRLRDEGIKQCLLEVITNNTAALRLYEKLGFERVREVALLQCDTVLKPAVSRPADVEVRRLHQLPDAGTVKPFWDGEPSWQNSIDALARSWNIKRVLGAFLGGELVGYVAFSGNFGRVAQMAVAPNHRNQGIGTTLLEKMQEDTAMGYSLQVINIDKSLDTACRFFINRGFYERLSQFEMTVAL